jgi:hypothetical protein
MKTLEEKREYQKKYYQSHRTDIIKKNKEYGKTPKAKEYDKKYYQMYKTDLLQKKKVYNKTQKAIDTYNKWYDKPEVKERKRLNSEKYYRKLGVKERTRKDGTKVIYGSIKKTIMKKEKHVEDLMFDFYIFNAYQHNKENYDIFLKYSDVRIYIIFKYLGRKSVTDVTTYRELGFLQSLSQDVRKDVEKNMELINSGGKYIREEDKKNPYTIIMLLSEAQRIHNRIENM